MSSQFCSDGRAKITTMQNKTANPDQGVGVKIIGAYPLLVHVCAGRCASHFDPDGRCVQTVVFRTSIRRRRRAPFVRAGVSVGEGHRAMV